MESKPKAQIVIKIVDTQKRITDKSRKHLIFGVLNSENDISQELFQVIEKHTNGIRKFEFIKKNEIGIGMDDSSWEVSCRKTKIFLGFRYTSTVTISKEADNNSTELLEREVDSVIERHAKDIINGLQDMLNSIDL